MKNKKDFKLLLKNNFVSLIVLVTLICLGVVFAGNVIVKEGAVDVGNDLNVSGNALVNGNLGVGTTNPSQKLEVTGAVTIGATTDPSNGQDMIYSRGVKYGVIGNLYSSGNIFMGAFVKANTTGSGYVSSTNINIGRASIETGATGAGGVIRFLTGPKQTSTDGGSIDISEVARFNEANLGIGTTTPSEKLDVNGSVSISQLLKLSSVTLPTCTTSLDGSIGKNSTGIYYCNSTVWRQISFVN